MAEAAQQAAPAPISDAQKLLNRLLATRARLIAVDARVEKLNSTIGARSKTEVRREGKTAQASTFFEGLEILTSELEAIADQLIAGVENLEAKF